MQERMEPDDVTSRGFPVLVGLVKAPAFRAVTEVKGLQVLRGRSESVPEL